LPPTLQRPLILRTVLLLVFILVRTFYFNRLPKNK
jgi:hypothetical protein